MARISSTHGPGGRRATPIYRDWTVLQLAALVFLLDQFTKYLVIQLLPFGWSYPAEGFFRFTHIHNTGSAFGIFQDQNTPLIFVSIIGILILILIYHSQARPTNWLRLSLGLQLGGAFGNLADRLRFGYVIDFIDVGPWPIFNIADASIVTGLFLLAWIFLGPGRKAEPEPETHREAPVELEWCPVCGDGMVPLRDAWRCLGCGVKERVDRIGIAVAQEVREDRYSVTPTETMPSGGSEVDGRSPASGLDPGQWGNGAGAIYRPEADGLEPPDGESRHQSAGLDPQPPDIFRPRGC
jgi:signal peptidase II